MRMWMVDPKLLCRQHLLGEHKELHMLAGTLAKGRSLGRFITDRLVSPADAQRRHSELVEEMAARGYNHRSPLTVVSDVAVAIDTDANLTELARRCPACAKRIRP